MQDDFESIFSFGPNQKEVSRSHRPYILLVSHDCSRTGAPIAFLHLACALQKLNLFEIRIISRTGGPLVDSFAHIAPLCVASEYCAHNGIGNSDFLSTLAERFAALKPRGLAICNTVTLTEYNEALSSAGVDVFTWIHELPVFFQVSDMETIVRTSKHIGVYSEWNNARYTGQYLIPPDKIVLCPPVLPLFPRAPTTEQKRRIARETIGVPNEALMVLGVGWRHPIKGTDLFIQIAARCSRLLSPADARRQVFYWIGAETDFLTSRTFEHDVIAHELENVVVMPGEQADPWVWYEAADLYVCTSRWEALSVSTLEAMSTGLPVVTFAEVGASRFVEGAGTVIHRRDLDAFSEAVVEYLNDPELRMQVGKAGHNIVRGEFGDGTLPEGLLRVVNSLLAS